jgi:Flp pilus assembly protein TadG
MRFFRISGGKNSRHRGLYWQHGAEIVEFIITLPVVLIALGIMFDFGSLLSDQVLLTDAARAAAREAINGASSAEVQQASDQITQSMISADSASLPVVSVTCASSPCSPGDQMVATINHTYSFRLLPAFISSVADIDLVATARMNRLVN